MMRFGRRSVVDNELMGFHEGFEDVCLTKQEARRVCGVRRRRYEK